MCIAVVNASTLCHTMLWDVILSDVVVLAFKAPPVRAAGVNFHQKLYGIAS